MALIYILNLEIYIFLSVSISLSRGGIQSPLFSIFPSRRLTPIVVDAIVSYFSLFRLWASQ